MNGQGHEQGAPEHGRPDGRRRNPQVGQPRPTRAPRGPAPIEEPDLAWRVFFSVLLVALALGALLLADEATAEDRSVQVVGVQPLDASASRAGGPRQGAVNQALYEAVSRVALDLVAEYGPPLPAEGGAAEPDSTAGGEASGDGEEDNEVKSALGRDMTPFARSFRIVEDQGSRPVLFPGESEATREYVVVVDVTVDVNRVRTRLAERGLIAVEEAAAPGGGLEIDALGLRHWSGFAAFVALLESPAVGASEVKPLEFEVGRARVFAAVQGDEEDVLARILAAAPSDLAISARGGAGGPDDGPIPRLELVVLWTPPDGAGR